jgi:formylglycine-generating enzyme required for sulfatase activity
MANSTATEFAMKAFKGESDTNWKYGQLHPADAVSRTEARAWCAQYAMRLPNEREWEYACRAGTTTVFYWGNQPDPKHCWMKANADGAQGEYITHSYMEHLTFTNAFGLIDMLGSMSEWVEDDRHKYQWLHSDAPYVDEESDDPDGILRGGCFMYDWKLNRCATRISCSDYGDTGISFRPVIDLPELDFAPDLKVSVKAEPEKPAKKWWKPW